MGMAKSILVIPIFFFTSMIFLRKNLCISSKKHYLYAPINWDIDSNLGVESWLTTK